jgi:predicted lipoprotein with Yx(FWY)xxD motif
MVTSMIVLAAALALPPDVPYQVQIDKQDHRDVLRTLDGDKQLYTYDRDKPGQSSCAGRCSETWPPLAAPADAKPVGEWKPVVRPDGSRQWAFAGRPVYTFARDPEGTPTGNGSGGVWRLLPSYPAP